MTLLSKRKNQTTPFLITSQRSFSFQEFHQASDKITDLLRENGLRSGMRVAVGAGPSVEFFLLFFSLIRLGAIVTLLPTRWPREVLKRIVNQVSVKHLFIRSSDMPLYRFQGKKTFEINQFIAQADSKDPEKSGATKNSLKDLVTIMATSGSSGHPKLVVHRLENHIYSALGSEKCIPFGVGDRWLCHLPVYHVSGLSIFWRAFVGGGAVVVGEGSGSLIQTVLQVPATHYSLVSFQLKKLLENRAAVAKLKKAKAVLLGGSSIDEGLLQQVASLNMPAYISYGSTEMSSQIATARITPSNYQKAQAKALPYRSVKLARDGEILVKGKTLCAGYWKRGRVFSCKNKAGWFLTGDMGRLDRLGRLTVKGRKDRMFISGGENIYPEEVEKALHEIPGVLGSYVYGIKDSTYGNRPVAFVKRKRAVKLTQAKLLSYLKKKLPKYMVPDVFYEWPGSGEVAGVKESIFLPEGLERQKGKWKKIL